MNILCIPDLHVPFHHPEAFDFLDQQRQRYQPDAVVCLGDEVDAYAFSRFSHDPDAAGPGDELRQAHEALARLYRLFPRVLVCESNHTLRPYKRAREAGLPTRMLRSIRHLLRAPCGWRWAPHWRLEGVLFLHGDGFSGKNAALDAAIRHRCSVVLGHVHAHAGVAWVTALTGSIFGMNCGCLIKPDATAFAYARHLAHRPTLGCGLLLDGVPHFEPFRGR